MNEVGQPRGGGEEGSGSTSGLDALRKCIGCQETVVSADIIPVAVNEE